MTSVRATEERPGADPLRPHADLLVPSSSSSLRPGSTSTLAHPLWANDQDSAPTPLRFGSIAPSSATPASSSSPSNAASSLSPATQVASLHRAAEVARWEWSKDHDVPLSTQGSPRPTTPVAAAPPASRSTGIGLIDVSDDSGASSSETLSGGESTTTSTSSESFDADAVERAFVAQMEARTQSTTRRPRPRNAVSSTGGLQADIESWSRMVYDLSCAAGVVDDGDEEHLIPSSSSSTRHTPPPPFLFGYTPGSRLFPHPWWARRYSGPAGAWLRSELLRRARDQPQPSSTAATQTPASAMANEWRRQSTAAAAATSRRGDDGVMLSFPSLDPQTRSGAAGTTFPAIRLEPTTSTEGTTGQPSAQAQPPPAAVPATSSTSVAVPSSTSASSFMTPGLFNPWRSPSAARPTTDTSSVTSTSQLLANPSRPPRTSHPPAASNVDRSVTAGVLELTAAVRAQQGAVGSGRPPAAAPSAASRHEPLPESAFQVPDASEAQRREAAQTVARLASAQRSAAATAAQRRAEPPQSSSSRTTRATGDQQQQQQRRREGHGMTYLRHLRSLDGIDSTPSSSPAPAASAASSSSSSSTPVRAYQVFPWYTPPTLDLAPAEVDAAASTRPLRLADPDGDAQGADWYRGVRARQENAQEEAAALRGLQDPNGEAMMLDDGDAVGVQGGMSLPPWRPRAPRPREGDDEDGTGRQGAARRQRNRTALVLATEDYDDDDQAGSVQRHQRGGSAINDGAAGGDEVATAGGWTLINPLFRNDEQQQQPHSPVRETRDEGSEITTNWLRGPNSTSPGPMASTTAASPPTSLRSLRRPRRLRSLASEDIIGAAGTNNNDSIAASSASLPTSSVQDAPPVRRAEHHGRRGTGAADNVRSMTIDELRDREERVHRLSLGGEAAVGQTPSHRASASASASTPAAAASSPPSTSSPWLSRISQNIEAELQQRQEELRASQQRLGEELTRRRRHLDELRQRQGRIGRVLERTAEAARNADRAGEDAAPASSSTFQPASDAATTSTPAAASLVRRRSVRDPAPAGLRAPRAVRLSQPASDPASSSSPRLRRSTSSATLGEDKELEEREAALASSSSSSSSASRALDDLALSTSPSSRSTGSGASSNVDLSRRNDSSPCLITPEDQARLGVQGTRLLRALDELGQRCGAYQEAALKAHRQRLLTWAPQQPALPSTAVPSSRHHGSSSGASATSYPLRVEPSRHEPQPSGARSVLRHDQNGLRFNAAEGIDVVLRFLAAMPPTSTSSSSTSAYPTSRQAEDRLWAAGRQRLLQRGRGTGSPATDAHEAHNERRRALGMAPRERQSDRDLERDARERERAREALPSITATPFGYMPITSINGGGPSGRTPWPQILARRPDLTAREYAVLSRFDLSGAATTGGGGGDDEDEQASPIQQPFSRASSLSALRSLSSEDIDVLRALVLRTTRGPGGFGAATSSRAAAASGRSNARGQSSQDNDDEEDLGSSDEESFPIITAVESTTATAATRTRTTTRTSSTLPGPALPSLFPSRAIALSEEDVQAIRSLAGSLFSTTAEQETSSSQQGDGATAISDGDGNDLVLRLASMDTAMAFIRRRAEAVAQAGEGRSSSGGAEPAVADPLGPLFTLSSLSLSLTRRACATAATTSATGSTSRAQQQQQRHQPAMTLHALVFVSDEPITKDAMREWEGKTAREVRQAVAASIAAGGNVGPGLAEEEGKEEEEEEEGGEQWDEEADLGDPFAVERRAASTARQQGSSHPASALTTITTNNNNNNNDAPFPAPAAPHLLPRALIPFTFPGTSSSSGAQMTMTTSQNINFDHHHRTSSHGRARAQTPRRRPALPIGRYLAVKILSTTTTIAEGEEDGEGALLDAAAVELSYVGARGWPAAGMSSVDGGECL